MVRVDRATHLRAGASHVWAKHDGPGSLVVELLAAGLETILEEFDVATTAVAALLVLDLVLDDKRLFREVDGLREWGRDGVVRGLRLRDEAEVALDDRHQGLLYLPFTDIAESLAADGGLLGRLRGSPARRPLVGELLDEGGLDLRGLMCRCQHRARCAGSKRVRTLKTGFSCAATPQTATARTENAALRIAKDRDDK